MDDKARRNSILDDAGRMLVDPAGFYRDMEKTGGFTDPLIYVVIMAAGTGLIFALLSLLGAGMTGAIAIGLGAVIVFPLVAVIGSFIAAAILYLVWNLLGSTEPYETGYRCVAYATVVYPVSALLGLVGWVGLAGVLLAGYVYDELLAGRSPQRTVIVAVIDGGVDLIVGALEVVHHVLLDALEQVKSKACAGKVDAQVPLQAAGYLRPPQAGAGKAPVDGLATGRLQNTSA